MQTGPDARIAEWRRRAEQQLDRGAFDYYAGGSGAEISLAESEVAWRAVRLRPRVLRDVSAPDTGTDLLGARLRAPLAVAPMATMGALHPGAEPAVARAVAATGGLMIVSTRASRTVEDIAATGVTWWQQVYLTRDRAACAGLVGRAVQAGARALVLTGDTPYVARKARPDRRDLASDEALVNLGRHLTPGADPVRAIDQDPAATLADIGWLARLSGLPVLVKGVLRGDDARACLDAGAGGVIVSNHGGRQLDRALPTVRALPEVVAAAGNAPVLVDGGVRSGTDVLVALALGARAVALGRPVAWALAADGQDGVRTLLQEVESEFAHVLALAGCRSPQDVDAGLVAPAQ